MIVYKGYTEWNREKNRDKESRTKKLKGVGEGRRGGKRNRSNLLVDTRPCIKRSKILSMTNPVVHEYKRMSAVQRTSAGT